MASPVPLASRQRWLHPVLAGFVLLLAACKPATSADKDKTLTFIMSDIGFNSEVVPILQAEVAKQGFVLDWVVVNDIIQPNKLVNDGQADANSFQHEPYYAQFAKDHDLKNTRIAFYTLFTPSGLFSRKHKSLAELPEGATIGIPVDPSNNGRALFLLRDKGLIKLRDGVDVIHASLKDITDNPRHLKFKEVDQLMLQRVLDDVDAGFLFLAYALIQKFDPLKDALALEKVEDTPYKSVVVVHKDVLGTPKLKALQNAFASDALKAYYRSKYGDSIIFLDSLDRP